MDKFDLKGIASNKKYQAIAGAVAITLFLGWWLVGRGGNEDEEAFLMSSASLNPAEILLGQDVLMSMQRMKAIQLEASVLKNPLFVNLKDLTVIIPLQPIGRRNPFASF